jgi:hypothetical protein
MSEKGIAPRVWVIFRTYSIFNQTQSEEVTL